MGLKGYRFPLVAIGLVCFVYALWPGDASFAFDEPVLIGKALRANAEHTLARSGLHGTKGITYSPLPVWIYQSALLISHDLRVIVAIRAVLCGAAVGLSLLWLARNLDLARWFAPVVLLSPSLWFFSRQLWDNTFCIPLSALALASYVQFLRAPLRGALLVSLGCLLGSLLIHLMSLPLVATILIHMILTQRQSIARHWRALLIVLAVACAIAIPWIRTIFEGQGADLSTGPDGWWFPLLGARTISGAHLAYIFGEKWSSAGGAVGAIIDAAVYVSLVAYPLMWLGMCVAAYRALEFVSRQRPTELRDHVSLILLGVILIQTLMYGFGHIYGLPHYYNGAWIAYPMLVWLGIDVLRRARIANVIIAAQGAALLIILGFLVVRIHRGNGRVHTFYGPSIELRMQVIAFLNERGWHGPFAFARPGSDQYVVDPLNTNVPLTPAFTDVTAFLAYPQSMNVLQELMSPGAASKPMTGRAIHVMLINPLGQRCELEFFER